MTTKPLGIMHTINGTTLEATQAGGLVIDGEAGRMTLTPREAYALLTFMRLADVVDLIEGNEAALQRAQAEAAIHDPRQRWRTSDEVIRVLLDAPGHDL